METKIMEEKNRRNERGRIRIVLIALIVCVIILLILVVVLIQKLSRKQSEAVNKEELKQDEECISAYADIDNDGTVDGIIYADLTVGGSAIWNPSGNPDYDSYGEFTIQKETEGLKEYYVSQESYTGDFGTGKVVSPVEGTSGKDRFYVMALDNVDNDYHCWYNSAGVSRINNYSSVAKEDFGSGKANTGKMIYAWNNETYIDEWNNETYDSKNTGKYTDMWGLDDVQNKYNGEPQWFVPSREEWVAFAYNLQIDSSNFGLKGLWDEYWSSSLSDSNSAWEIDFRYDCMRGRFVTHDHCVRLSVTF